MKVRAISNTAEIDDLERAIIASADSTAGALRTLLAMCVIARAPSRSPDDGLTDDGLLMEVRCRHRFHTATCVGMTIEWVSV
jgi:hypothetical protein